MLRSRSEVVKAFIADLARPFAIDAAPTGAPACRPLGTTTANAPTASLG